MLRRDRRISRQFRFLIFAFMILVLMVYPIVAKATSTHGQETREIELHAVVRSGIATAVEIQPTEPVVLTSTPQSGRLYLGGRTLLLVGVGALGLLALVVVVVIIVVVVSRRRKKAEEERPHPHPVDDHTITVPLVQPLLAQYDIQPAPVPLAILRVRASDDPMMIGQMINLTKTCTTIGRSAENDIVLPRDKAVSRQHAMIEKNGAYLFLSEFIAQEADGIVKHPTYGTLVNGIKVGDVPVQLKTGDEIQLGTNFIMQFEQFESALSSHPIADNAQDNPGRIGDKTIGL